MAGAHVVSGSADATVRVWNKESGELVRTLPAQAGAVSELLLPPRYIADEGQLAVYY